MRKYIQAWRKCMLLESENPLLLNEGLFDLGLPAEIAESINKDFEGVPEKGKTIIGNLFKKQVFNKLTRGYAMPLMNDVVSLSDQIFEFTLDLFNDDKALDKLSTEDKEKLTQFLQNVKNTIIAEDPSRIRFREYSDWKTKVGDIQKAIKMVKKGYSRGIVKKLIGDTAEVKSYPEMFEMVAEDIYDNYARAIGQMTLDVQTWLKSHPDEYKKIPKIIEDSNYFPDTALIRYAKNWLHDVETEEQKIHTFKDTSYWYDLRTSSCDIEGERMGHCGGDPRVDTLFSLRYKRKGKQKSSSYVTVGYSEGADMIHQIKGRYNKAPEEKFYKHIAWLIDYLGDPRVVETGEHSDDLQGFAKMSDWLRENTGAEVGKVNTREDMEEKIRGIQDSFNNQYYYARLYSGMADPRGLVNPDDPAYYMQGIVGIPIGLDEFKENPQKRSKSWPTRDQMKEISQLMDSDRLFGDGVAAPPTIRENDIIFYFYAAHSLIDQDSEWILSYDSEDLEQFGEYLLEMDREVTVEGNKLQEDLKRALISSGYMDGKGV